ncbi:MAG: TMEM175 family protein [Rhizomicrobium sp.]
MEKHRVLAMTDGVVAIIITIMVLELKAPAGADFEDLHELWPVFIAYALSFIYVAIYWNNHHHYFHLVTRVNGAVMWANFHLLFWLSLIPFSTAWLGEHAFASAPAALYGVSLLMPALAWVIMQKVIIRAQGEHSRLRAFLGRDFKGTISPVLYLSGILLSFVAPWAALLCYAVVTCIWLVPDRRIEQMAAHD